MQQARRATSISVSFTIQANFSLPRSFLERLNLALNKSGVSRSSLAEQLGIAKSTITRWSHGAIPREEIVTRIASITGVRREWLAAGLGDMEPISTGRLASVRTSTIVEPEADYLPAQASSEQRFLQELETFTMADLIRIVRLITLSPHDKSGLLQTIFRRMENLEAAAK